MKYFAVFNLMTVSVIKILSPDIDECRLVNITIFVFVIMSCSSFIPPN